MDDPGVRERSEVSMANCGSPNPSPLGENPCDLYIKDRKSFKLPNHPCMWSVLLVIVLDSGRVVSPLVSIAGAEELVSLK